MKEFKAVTLEVKGLTCNENEEVINGEVILKEKEFKYGSVNDDYSITFKDEKVKITHCVKSVGFFTKNEKGLFELSFNEKGFFDKEKLDEYIKNSLFIYSKGSVHLLIKQLIAMNELEKKMKKYQKKGWHTFYVGRAEKETGEEVILHFACKDHSTPESKRNFYNSKLKEFNLTHKTLDEITEISQLDTYRTLFSFLENSQ